MDCLEIGDFPSAMPSSWPRSSPALTCTTAAPAAAPSAAAFPASASLTGHMPTGPGGGLDLRVCLALAAWICAAMRSHVVAAIDFRDSRVARAFRSALPGFVWGQRERGDGEGGARPAVA